MPNTKIQALWQLTQELKAKRESLKEKLSYTQNYLDEQQLEISTELHALKQANHGLSQDLKTVIAQLQTLHSQWQEHQKSEISHLDALQDRDQNFQDLILEFERLSAERQLIEAILPKSSPASQELAHPLLEDFDSWYSYTQEAFQKHLDARVEQLEHPGEDVNDSLEAIRQSLDFLADFQPAWNELKPQLIAELGSEQNSDLGNTAIHEEVETLQKQYQEMEQLLEHTQTELKSRQELFQTASESVDLANSVQSEFEALRNNNNNLSNDLQKLEAQTDQLIQLVETYRQAALEALAQSEENKSDEDESAEPGSKSEASRDAIRKKVVQVLRHRFNKAPRKITNALKEISNNKAMDNAFDLALTSEDLKGFEDSFFS